MNIFHSAARTFGSHFSKNALNGTKGREPQEKKGARTQTKQIQQSVDAEGVQEWQWRWRREGRRWWSEFQRIWVESSVVSSDNLPRPTPVNFLSPPPMIDAGEFSIAISMRGEGQWNLGLSGVG